MSIKERSDFASLQKEDIERVSGGISQSTQIGAQMGFMTIGFGMTAAGLALTPLGAGLLIGTSVCLTASFFAEHWAE